MKSLHLTIFFTIAFLFAACSTSHIAKNDNGITITIDKIQLVAKAKTVQTKSFHFPPIYVTQKIKKIKGERYIVYESAKCDSGYLFDKSIDILFYKIFKPQKSKLLKRYGNIYFYIATIDEKPINLIIYNQNKKRIDFLYPIPNDAFEKLLNKFSKDRMYKKAPQKSVEATSPNDLTLSKWSAKSIVLDTLVKKTGGKILR